MAGAHLFVWLLGLFGIVSIVAWLLFQLVTKDSFRYDEDYVWLRKLDEEVKLRT